MRIIRFIMSAMIGASMVAAVQAQAYPEADYDPSVPTLEEVVGHEFGDAITTSADIDTFLEALRDHSPDRMTIETYAESWQGRDLSYAVISSAENMARLDAIKGDLAAIGDEDFFNHRFVSLFDNDQWFAEFHRLGITDEDVFDSTSGFGGDRIEGFHRFNQHQCIALVHFVTDRHEGFRAWLR